VLSVFSEIGNGVLCVILTHEFEWDFAVNFASFV